MQKRALDTAKVVKFFDNLFDSMNGGTYRGEPGKPLKTAVRNKSPHLHFWESSIVELKKMSFRKEGTMECTVPPSLKNLILTVEGFIEVRRFLLDKVPFFLPRSFNQDPLENYFGQMRQHRGRNSNPTCAQFKDSYKALLVRSLCSTHSVAANCEETFDVTLVQLENLIAGGKAERQVLPKIIENVTIYKDISLINEATLLNPLNKAALGYISGFVAKKLIKNVTCNFCKQHIFKKSASPSEYTILISAKEFHMAKRSLTYCNDYFVSCIYKCFNIAKLIIGNYNVKLDLKKTITYYVKKVVPFSFVCDHRETLISLIINYIVDLCIFTFCKRVNAVLCGKECIRPTSCKLLKKAHETYRKRFSVILHKYHK